jgi:preprotein translocase subunit SecD
VSKRLRLLIVLAVVGVAVWFLLPTIRWYGQFGEVERAHANASRDQVRALARSEASDALEQLKSLARADLTGPIPVDLEYTTGIARDRLRSERREVPREWTIGAVTGAFPAEGDIFVALEDYYREQITALKDTRDASVQLGLDLQGGMYVVIQPDLDALEEQQGRQLSAAERDSAVRRSLQVLENRIDQFGVTEPQIRQSADEQIIVEVPGAPDPERMDRFILGKGRLSFHIVSDDALQRFRDYQAANPAAFLAPNGQPADSSVLSAGEVLRGRYEKDAYGGDQLVGYTVIRQDVGLDGTHIEGAQVSRDPFTQQPTVVFNLDQEGGDIFFNLTSDNVGNVMAVVLDDKVKAAAVISQAIRNNVVVSGFTQLEADDLALVLETGALPVPLEVISQQAIGASLGEDSIRQGIRAVALGMAAVLIFMLLYYQVAGLIANFALLLNLFFLLAVLSAFNFTLTLPSIAGVILTVGMAVDANVIIYERVKEEYRLGKTAGAAIQAGYAKAFWTVMDANITTFIAAVALSYLGSGPIRGFAITLSVGILSSMFSALVVSRLVYDFLTETLHVQRLRISWRPNRSGGRSSSTRARPA